MKKHKGKIQMGIVIGIFSVIIVACLISIFSRLYAENKEMEEFRQLAEIVTEETTNTDTVTERIKKPNILKVSDFDNEVQAEQTVYYTTYYEPHSISELISMNSECFGWISIAGININYAKEKSIYNTEITPVYGQQILTLSTCYGYNQDNRILVLAVRN